MIKRVVAIASLALPLAAGLTPPAGAATAVPGAVTTSAPMFCIWNQQVNVSYCQYRLPKVP